jgi:hypothetical protein
MTSSLEDAKRKLTTTKYRHAGEQEDDLMSLLEDMSEHQTDLLRWEFVEHQIGFVDPRKQAGLIYYSQYPDETWSILEKLIKSKNPDDRDTACEVLMEIGGERANQLIKPLLNDPYPYLQFEACDYLKDIFLTDVVATLQQLLINENDRVRKQAQNKLDALKDKM